MQFITKSYMTEVHVFSILYRIQYMWIYFKMLRFIHNCSRFLLEKFTIMYRYIIYIYFFFFFFFIYRIFMKHGWNL
jgi:hypothetical protein